MYASVYFLPRAAAAGWWWSLPMFYILASVIITYETSGWLVVVVGFQFSLSFTPPCFYTSTTPKTFFFLLLKSKCMYTHTHIEREAYIRKSLFLLYTILSIHTRLFYFPPSSRVSSSFGSLAPTSFSPLKKDFERRHSLLCLEDMCYRLIHRREKDSLFSSACIGSPTSQKSTPRTLTHRRRRRRTSFWFYIFSAGVERKEWN